jgi:WD40 repeat protein
MQRLQTEGIVCAAIDVTAIGTQEIAPQQWYGGLTRSLVNSLELSEEFNLREWWRQRDWLTPVQCWAEFLEGVLLKKIEQEKIVIFIDEVDSLLSLSFKDDFFAVIRAFYNKQIQKPENQRLTFALLGVATPTDLISDKNRTPFNIGQAIELTGFELQEAEILAQGLASKVGNPQAALKAVLNWTGGQPFLTQKLCKLLVSSEFPILRLGEAEWVARIVQTQVIENWETNDEPAHLRTIRDRILHSEQRAGRLLGLYQQILRQGEVAADESPEQIELRLSGFVVKQQGKLRVYNRIYESVFNLNWVDKELAKLRPYSEAFTAWLASGCKDDSRLLQGQALQEALEWAASKSLSDRDYEFLSASQKLDKREIEIALVVKEEEGRILTQANETLTKAQEKAKRQIRRGVGVLLLSIIGAISAGIFASNTVKQARESQEGIELEQQGVIALRRFESQELEALLAAMDVGQRLRKLVQDGRSLEKYPATSPILALQTILDNIHEQNRVEGLNKSLAFSPNSQRIVSANGDTAEVWDITGRLLADLKGHQSSVSSASFSPNGQLIVTTSVEDKTAKVWDITGRLLADLKGHQNSVNSASFSPNGEHIVTTSTEDKTAKVWDTTGRLLAELKGVISASFSPDGQRIVTSSDLYGQLPVRLWDLSGKLLAQVEAGSASFSPDGQRIVTYGHNGGVESASFSPDGQRIVTIPNGLNSIAKVWDTSGRLLANLKLSPRGMNTKASWSEDGQRIFTFTSVLDDLDIVSVWDLSARRFGNIKKFWGDIYHVVGSPDGQHILMSDSSETVSVWNLSGRLLWELKGYQGGKFSPDGQHILTFRPNDRTIQVWNLSGELIAKFKGWNGIFSPDSKRIITTFIDKPTAQVWDLSGRLLTELKGYQGVIMEARFSPDGQRIITESADNTARIWDLSGKVLAEIKEFDSNPRIRKLRWQAGLYYPTSSFSSDGQRILTVSSDNTVHIWGLSGKMLTKKTHQDEIREASFSPDGQRILIAFNTGTAHVLDLSGRLLAELKGHQNSISQASFSPDGQRILTVSLDKTARLWDLSGRLLAELKMLDSRSSFPDSSAILKSAFFSQDGKQIVTVSHEGIIRIWRVGGLDDLLARGCNWLRDYLATHPKERERLKVCQQKYSSLHLSIIQNRHEPSY